MAVKTKPTLAFTHYKASETLKKLAINAPDLTTAGCLTPERIAKYVQKAAGLKLLFATERVNDEILVTLYELAWEAKAVEKMQAMQAGMVINKIEGYPSEERTVLHTAMRDLFENPSTSKVAKEATDLEKKELEKLKAFLNRTEGCFTDLVMIGIGGSNLGPEAAFKALAYLKPDQKRIFFVANVDPDENERVLRKINMKETVVVVVSKSGTTIETESNHQFFREKFIEAGLNPHDHFVAMTGEGSPLDNKKDFLECFYSWDFIGGRYSTTAMYGAVLLSFAIGFDHFMEFLRGAHAMDMAALSSNLQENMPLTLALLSIWNHNFLGHSTLAMIPYSSALSRLPAHIQQVEMESNGKHIDRHGLTVDFETGMIIWGEPGTNAQHSFFQLIHQGTPIIPLEMIGFKKCQYGVDSTFQGTTNQEKLIANMVAQALALAQGKEDSNPNKFFTGNRPSHILYGEQLTPFAFGALFALLEHRVAFEGFIWDINSFDQEGVQLGKVLAGKMLSCIQDKSKCGQFPLGEAYLKLLDF